MHRTRFAPAVILSRLRRRFARAAGRAAALSGQETSQAHCAREWRRLWSLAHETARLAGLVETDGALRAYQAQRDIELAAIAARSLSRSARGVA